MQDKQYPSRDSKRQPPEYKSEALPREPTCSANRGSSVSLPHAPVTFASHTAWRRVSRGYSSSDCSMFTLTSVLHGSHCKIFVSSHYILFLHLIDQKQLGYISRYSESYGLDGISSIPGRKNRVFSTPQSPDQLWAHPAFYPMGRLLLTAGFSTEHSCN
jgi:hypothetical protein